MEMWSWTLALIGMTGVYLTTKKMITGFIVGVSVQGLWVAFAISTAHYGFIFSALGYGFINFLGIMRWRRDARQQSVAGEDPDDS